MSASSLERNPRLRHPSRLPGVAASQESKRHAAGRRKIAGVSWIMWTLLAASVLVLSGVRHFVQREEARALSEAVSVLADETHMTVKPVGSPTRADRLHLGWQDVEGAHHYLLRIHSNDQGMIFDRLRVSETAWLPGDDLVTVLKPGDYTWEVEALGPEGRVIARSGPLSFEIRR